MRTPNHKRPVPRAIRRVRIVQDVVQVTLMVGMCAYTWLGARGMLPRLGLPTYTPYGFLLGIVAVIAWRFKREARLKRLATDCGGLLCDNCTYDLRGADVANLHDGGTPAPTPAPTCPECGEPFTPEGLRERWAV